VAQNFRDAAGMKRNDLEPGEPVPQAGVYQECNVFGTPTGAIAVMNDGEQLPAAPRGFTWRPLSGQSAAELRAKAVEYRQMAASATTPGVMESLLRLANRFADLAAQRERDG
jgi:hypothetical protein